MIPASTVETSASSIPPPTRRVVAPCPTLHKRSVFRGVGQRFSESVPVDREMSAEGIFSRTTSRNGAYRQILLLQLEIFLPAVRRLVKTGVENVRDEVGRATDCWRRNII